MARGRQARALGPAVAAAEGAKREAREAAAAAEVAEAAAAAAEQAVAAAEAALAAAATPEEKAAAEEALAEAQASARAKQEASAGRAMRSPGAQAAHALDRRLPTQFAQSVAALPLVGRAACDRAPTVAPALKEARAVDGRFAGAGARVLGSTFAGCHYAATP